MNYWYIPGIARKQTLEQAVCREWGISEEQLFEKTRRRPIVTARQFYAYALAELFRLGPKHAAFFTGQDHTTMTNSCKKSQNFYETEPDFRQRADKIITLIHSDQIERPENHRQTKYYKVKKRRV